MVSVEVLKELAQSYKVLYVEDDKEVRSSVLDYLQNFFKNVQTAVDGLEGLSFYKKSTYDIVITDIDMPKLNGIDMSIKIKEINNDQEILIVSAYSDTKLLMESIRIGVSGYITKPIDFKQVQEVLYKILYKLESFRENNIYKKNLEKLIEQKSKEQRKNYEKTISSLLTMVEERDTYTGEHSQRVANYSKLIAKEMGYDKDKTNLLYRASILHDIGKITTPDSILLKPGKLSDLEYHIIQEHVTMSNTLLKNIPMYEELIEIIIAHHEHYDGSGYPNGLKKDEINELAHIMIVSDSFDAMTTSRIYKARKNTKTAIKELKKLSGTHFHPDVVASAIKVLSLIDTSHEVSQFPKSELEQERFSYFYKDQLSDLHNSNYLDVILKKNIDIKEYSYLYVVNLKNFSQYNNKYGWLKGDELLKEFSALLEEYYSEELLFRINAGNFVILNKEAGDTNVENLKTVQFILEKEITLDIKELSIIEKQINSIIKLEDIILNK